MTAPNYTTITGTFDDGSGTALSGTAVFTPSATVYATGGPVVSADIPVNAKIVSGSLVNASAGPLQLLATDNTNVTVEGSIGFWYWNVVVTVGGVQLIPFSFLLPSSPSTVDLYALGGVAGSTAGFVNPMTTLGDLISGGSGGAAGRLAGNTTTAMEVLTSTGTGSAATAAAWKAVALLAAPWQFPVGAPSGGDDTAHINSVVTAATAYAAANDWYAEIVFEAAVYKLSGATTKTSTNKGNAQIPLPINLTSNPTLILAFKGSGSPCGPMFDDDSLSAVAQTAGTVLNCTLTGQTTDGTYGAPSVIGGPTPQQGYGTAGIWNNIKPVIDGITVLVPTNPTVSAFDFRTCAKMSVPRAAMIPDDTVDNIRSTTPTHSWATGLYTPQNLNNDDVLIGDVTCYGFYYGFALGEHASWHRIEALYCWIGLGVQADGNGDHGWAGTYYSAEGNQYHIQSYGSTSTPRPLSILQMDCEAPKFFSGGGAGYHIDDTGGALGGYVGLVENDGTANILINGCASLEIISQNQARAVQPAPAYTLGTAFQNPWWRHAWITLNTGTTTGILIGPTSAAATTSVGTTTTSPVTFRLPSGWWLNIQGSGKPSVFNAVLD